MTERKHFQLLVKLVEIVCLGVKSS